MRKAGEIIYSIPQTMYRILQSFGTTLGFIGRDIRNLDFTDSSGDIRNSFSELTSTVELLGTQIADGFKALLEPTGEVDIPSTGEQQPDTESSGVPAPTPGGGGGGGRWKPLLDVIGSGEGGYTSIYPSDQNPNLTKMTIAEASRAVGQRGGRGAIGKYQFTSPISQAKSANLNPDKDLFSPSNQDKMAVAIIENKRGGKDWLAGKITDEQFGYRLAKEFAGLKQPNGVGFYDGDGRNKASVNWSVIKSSLQKVKSTPTAPPKPTVTPQTPLSTNFAAVTGTSGASQGDKPLSVPYSPFKPGSGATITSGKGMRWGRPHTGYDLAASPGTPLYAYFPGKVTHIGLDGTSSSAGYGNWVVWKDDVYGAYHFFGHMKDRPPVSVGQTVNQGTLMGTVGNTGRSKGPHLHWEISNNPPKSNGQFTSYEDPGSWLKKHPLKKSDVSPQLAKIPSEKEVTPTAQQPQISSAVPQQQRAVADSVTTERMGQQFLFIDDRSSAQQPSVSAGSQKSYGGGVSGQIAEFDLLNKFMKQKLLLDFNYL